MKSDFAKIQPRTQISAGQAVPGPRPATPQPRPEKPVYLSVKADKSMFIGNNQVTDDTMISELNALTDGKKDTTIFFRADKTVDYETMMKVMDTLHQTGFLKIGLVGEETVKAK